MSGSRFDRAVHFPPGLIDRRGFRLRPGSAVRLADGRHGEVTGWSGAQGVDVYTADGELVTTSPFELERTDEKLPNAISLGRTVLEVDAPSTLLVVTVGSRSLLPRDHPPALRELPPKPEIDPALNTREFAEAWRDWLNSQPSDVRGPLMAELLHAPLLGRVLNEASLGATVERLLLVVTDQGIDPFRATDTIGIGELMIDWMTATQDSRDRAVDQVLPPAVLRHAPHVLQAVVHYVQPQIERGAEGLDRVAVVRTGGTPAMGFGTLLAAINASEQRYMVRDIDVPRDQPLIEMDVGTGHPLDDHARGVRSRP